MKPKNQSFSSQGPTLPPPTREQIAALAHELWLARGCPEGSDMDIWLDAERQLQGYAPRPNDVDPIPADPGNPNEDVAVRSEEEQELDDLTSRPGRRSATSLG